MENNTQEIQQVAAIAPPAMSAAPTVEMAMNIFSSKDNFNTAWTMATNLANSTIVPVQFQKAKTPEAVANCLIALEMANRIGASPLMVMQNLYVVYGNVGWSSKFLIASLNTCGKFSPLRYEYENEGDMDKWRCRAWAIDKITNTPLHGAWVSMQMAKDEGWFTKSGSKWKTMPELMLQYRAAAFFQRTYAPEISMGMQTREELEDIIDVPFEDVTPRRATAQPFDISKLKTETDINAALLRGDINKDTANNLRVELTKQRAAADIMDAVAKSKQPDGLFPEDNK